YYDLNYVNGLSVYKNSLSISYNQNMNIVNDLRLDVDYLGRIISISSDVEDVNKKVNLSDGKEVSYIGASGYLYDNMIENYSVNPITINDNYSPKTELDIKDYDARLSGALKYAGDFEVSYMGDYIAYKSEKEAELIVISINGNIASYKINNNGIIRTNISGQKALYINVDGIVYNLSITLID
nr:hypothetical protein [Bacilli bacterium]